MLTQSYVAQYKVISTCAHMHNRVHTHTNIHTHAIFHYILSLLLCCLFVVVFCHYCYICTFVRIVANAFVQLQQLPFAEVYLNFNSSTDSSGSADKKKKLSNYLSFGRLPRLSIHNHPIQSHHSDLIRRALFGPSFSYAFGWQSNQQYSCSMSMQIVVHGSEPM